MDYVYIVLWCISCCKTVIMYNYYFTCQPLYPAIW